jgi:hypothetical protein
MGWLAQRRRGAELLRQHSYLLEWLGRPPRLPRGLGLDSMVLGEPRSSAR